MINRKYFNHCTKLRKTGCQFSNEYLNIFLNQLTRTMLNTGIIGSKRRSYVKENMKTEGQPTRQPSRRIKAVQLSSAGCSQEVAGAPCRRIPWHKAFVTMEVHVPAGEINQYEYD